MRRVEVKHRDVLVPFFALLTANATILLVWTLVDPLEWERTYSMQTLVSTGQCKSSGNAWKYCVSFLALVNFGSIVTANIMAYKGRHIGSDFVESKWIMLCTASIFQVFLIGAPLLVLVSDSATAQYFVSAILVFVVGESVLLFVFVPKMFEMKQRSSTSGQVRINLPSTTRQSAARESLPAPVTRESLPVTEESRP